MCLSAKEKRMTLSDGKVGKTYTVLQVQMKQQNIARRLEALGILEMTRVQVLNTKKGGAFIIKVRGTRLAIGRSIAQGIMVREA